MGNKARSRIPSTCAVVATAVVFWMIITIPTSFGERAERVGG
ncbi:hypothetical protein FM101_02380 [Arthrobacter rhombi]|uniref:Uncharacterized protein n=1 Tax=Arthrobacter rhombi TaxID=71253 RepID=A0A1R4F5V2_9MICC|nr:hypothetical protein FM101_02380 [Arthrobacter rhombi]